MEQVKNRFEKFFAKQFDFWFFCPYSGCMSIWTNEDHQEWADLALRTYDFIDKLTGRSDITVTVHPNPAPLSAGDKDAPGGWFIPSKADMHFNAKLLFDKSMTTMKSVDPSSVVSQRQFPLYIGTGVHESGHARHTTYAMPSLPPLVGQIMTMLEEPRCERGTLAEWPQYASFLKMLTVEVVAKEFFANQNIVPESDLSDRFRAANLAILLIGREFNEVFTRDELIRVHEIMQNIFGAHDYKLFLDLLEQGLSVADDKPEELVEVSKKMAKLIDPNDEMSKAPDMVQMFMPCGASTGEGEGSDGEGEGEGEGESQGNAQGQGSGSPSNGQSQPGKGSGSGQPQPGKGSGQGDSKGSASGSGSDDEEDPENEKEHGGISIADILNEMANKASDTAREMAAKNRGEVFVPKKSQSEKNAEHRASNKASQRKVKFPSGRGAGWDWSNITVSSVAPTADDLIRVRALSNAISKAQFRDVHKSEVKSMLPPGRLNIRQAMNRAGQVAARSEITATPWSQVRRREVDNPPITLAVATDVSGSMDRFQREVCSFTWAFSSAVRKLKGKCGALAWNTVPWELINPGTGYPNMPIASAGGGSTGLPETMKALDSMVDLSFGEGVRVLVVITDSELPNGKEVNEVLSKMMSYGVKVLWISTTRSLQVRPPKGATVAVLESPDDFGRIVSKNVIDVLSNA